MTLEDLAFQLNTYTSESGTTFDALVGEDRILEVTCSNNDEFPINVTATDTQLLAVTPLFHVNEVVSGGAEALHEMLLRLSPAVPLSSIGLQGDTYILFGAMAKETLFENIAHELEVQAENTIDVLEVVEDFLN